MSDSAIYSAVGILVAVLIAVSAYVAIEEQRQWEIFARQHDCRKVGDISATNTTAVGIGTNGQVTIVPIHTPGKTGWSCNDGITYWR